MFTRHKTLVTHALSLARTHARIFLAIGILLLTTPIAYAAVLFESEWNTSLGVNEYNVPTSSASPTSDGGRWTWVGAGGEVVQSTGLDFPTQNVLRVPWDNGVFNFVRKEDMPIPAVGESRYYRWYFRFTLADTATGSINTHPFQDGPTAPTANWMFNVYPYPNGTWRPDLWAGNYNTNIWPNVNWLGPYLTKNTTYRFELHLLRSGTNTMQLHIRVYDTAGNLLYDDDDFRNEVGTLLSTNPTFPLPDITYLDGFNAGSNNDGGGSTDYGFQGAICIRDDDWCGAYVPPSTPPPAITPVPVLTLLTPTNPNCGVYPVPSVSTSLRTFHVNALTGNDANNGLTTQTAWKTLSRANTIAQPGDTFLLNGTFSGEYVRPVTSGTELNKITYTSEPGERGILAVGQYDTTVWLDGLNYIVIDGIEITNTNDPILIRDGASNIWIRNVYIHDSGSISIQGSDNNRIEDSVFDRIGSASSGSGNAGDAINIWADTTGRTSDNNIIVRNTFLEAGHAVMSIGGYQSTNLFPTDNTSIAHNKIRNTYSGGINLNGFAQNTLVECNFIADSGTSTVSASQNIGTRNGILVQGTNNSIRYNVITGTAWTGITVQGHKRFNSVTQNALTNAVYHNTIVNSNGAAIQILQFDDAQTSGNIIENNIFWGTPGITDGSQYYQIELNLFGANSNNLWPQGSANGNIIRYNTIASVGDAALLVRTGGNGGNVPSATIAAAESTYAGWQNNLRSDPLFTSNTDFTLQTTSPAINSGNSISGVSYTGVAPDRGAFESGSTVIPPTRRTGDLDGNGIVNLQDVILIIQNFKRRMNYDEGADINTDGIVNIFDMVLLGRNWG